MCEVDLTVLLPCLNERKSIAFCIDEAYQYIRKSGVDAEILVVDNCSNDGSPEIAKQCGARVLSVSEKGYGSAITHGIKEARGKYILMADCDGSYDFSSLDAYLQKLREGYALVVGNRYLGGIESGAMPFLHRYVGVPILSMLGRLRYGVKIGDFHCGMRAFDRKKALTFDFCCSGMEFATEMIGKFAKAGESICEIPTVLRRDLRDGKSHLRTVSDGWRHLKLIIFGKCDNMKK